MAELLYEKIYNDLLNKIQSRIYDEGTMLPTELEMESIYNASKAPIRQALAKLHDDGFIVRRAGKGTFVSGRSCWPYARMSGVIEELNAKGKFLRCITHSIKIEKLPKNIADVIGMKVGTKVVNVVRIRYYKDQPVNYMHHYVIGMSKQDIEHEGNFSSMLAVYDKRGILISRTDDVIEAVAASKVVANGLGIEPGYPLLLNNRTTFKADGSVLEFVKVYMNTKDWKYRAHYLNTI